MSDYRDLFGPSRPRARDLFGAPASQAPSGPARGRACAPASIATPAGLASRHGELQRQHESMTHRVIDLTQSLKLREAKLNQMFGQAKRQADELQQCMRPKRLLSWLRPDADKTRAHQLVDELQAFMRSEWKPDMFLVQDMNELLDQTGYLERLSLALRNDAETLLPAENELLQDILTQCHVLSLQAASSRQLTDQLRRQLRDMDDWRTHFLSLLVVDIQQRL
ncbi:hypothetical protein DK842_00855 [Chromobacterium phragmitis]|uniref:Uncharacterized protein n=1 Tax=Chromobacterium phragmitis TaxID=2202141 RepID=A0A344UF76_9NEIS|nr:hypothetical protein [Chromobacterium phragmitis]AXE28600.1 hypothetical protein DK842_00855 [Chromobacterium phragmitis]AXE33924.1 hypothetical protein DK843_06135 [Chromobacterium phragmitis]